MAWRRPGDKPLSEPMIFCLLTHICLTRPQWVKIGGAQIHYWYQSDLVWNHWSRVPRIWLYVSKMTIFGLDNCLSLGQRQTVIWTNAGKLLIRTLAANFSEILSEISTFSFKIMHMKMSPAKMTDICLGLNVLNKSQRPLTIRSRGISKPRDHGFHFVLKFGSRLSSST